jgi:two-component system NarL family response regulator
MMAKIRVLIADSRELLAIGMKKVIEESGVCEVVGVCNTGDEAIELANKLNPDIAFIDINIMGTNANKTAFRIRELTPKTRIIILTAESQNAIMNPLDAFDSMAEGYCDLDVDATRLLSTIQRIHDGGLAMSPVLANKFIRIQHDVKSEKKQPAEPEEKASDSVLSKREEEVLILVSKGKTNKEIATALFVTENTIKAHLHSILAKMEATTRQQAAFKAREKGVLL